MNFEHLDFLLRGGHYNVPTRKSLGIWPHPPLRMSEVISHISKILERERWFPRPWQPVEPGKMVDDTGCLEKVSSHRIIYRAKEASMYDLCAVSKQTEQRFYSEKKAIRTYLKYQLGLPGDLDGWKVVDRKFLFF